MSETKTLPTIDSIREDFSFLDDWEDRYRYVIELGKALPDLPEDEKIEDQESLTSYWSLLGGVAWTLVTRRTSPYTWVICSVRRLHRRGGT